MKKVIALLRRILAWAWAAALLLGLCACSRLYRSKSFDSLGELKNQLGTAFLYPEILPEGFTCDTKTFTGLYYDDSDTWEYRISYSNSALETDAGRHALLPGKFEIHSVYVRCYEPVHKPPRDRAGYIISSKMEIEKFEASLLTAGPENFLDIEGAEVIFKSLLSGKTTGEASYLYTHPSAEFMSGGILYEVSVAIYANETEDYEALKSYGRKAAEFMARSMLGPETAQSLPAEPFAVKVKTGKTLRLGMSREAAEAVAGAPLEEGILNQWVYEGVILAYRDDTLVYILIDDERWNANGVIYLGMSSEEAVEMLGMTFEEGSKAYSLMYFAGGEKKQLYPSQAPARDKDYMAMLTLYVNGTVEGIIMAERQYALTAN